MTQLTENSHTLVWKGPKSRLGMPIPSRHNKIHEERRVTKLYKVTNMWTLTLLFLPTPLTTHPHWLRITGHFPPILVRAAILTGPHSWHDPPSLKLTSPHDASLALCLIRQNPLYIWSLISCVHHLKTSHLKWRHNNSHSTCHFWSRPSKQSHWTKAFTWNHPLLPFGRHMDLMTNLRGFQISIRTCSRRC